MLSKINLPNGITLLRIALVPLILALYHGLVHADTPLAQNIFRYTALFFYLIATFSDLLDGYLARRRKQTSVFGTLIDPLADKLLALSLMIVFSLSNALPVWYTLIFLWREMIITALRGVAAEAGIIVSASSGGKRKTLYLNIGLGFLFTPPELMQYWPFQAITWGSLALAMGYCLSSGLAYIRDVYRGIVK